MSDKTVTIQEIRDWVREFRDKRDWGGPNQNTKNAAISLVLEAVELLEHYQWLESNEVVTDKDRKREVELELVDVLYWVTVLADEYGMDLSQTLKVKLEIGERRYPATEFVRGLGKKERLKRYYALKKLKSSKA